MIAAEIHGKVSPDNPAHDRMEDTLTSCIFSLFRYMSNLEVFSRFLGKAKNSAGQYLQLGKIISCDIFFWPLFRFERSKSREPDAFMALRLEEGRSMGLVLEAKYDSGLSNVHLKGKEEEDGPDLEVLPQALELGHQLADEYCGIQCGEWYFREAQKRIDPVEFLGNIKEKYLLYVTSGLEIPKSDLNGAISAIAEPSRCLKASAECSRNAAFGIYWVSWRDLYTVLDEQGLIDISYTLGKYTSAERFLLSDSAELLKSRGLNPFKPFMDLVEIAPVEPFFEDFMFFEDLQPIPIISRFFKH